MDKTDTNSVELYQVPYEVERKRHFTETVKRIADKYAVGLEGLGDE